MRATDISQIILSPSVESIDRMSTKKTDRREHKNRRLAGFLMESVRAVLVQHPQTDPDNVRHTLILLEQPPLELSL